jgi:glycosyltransferase involved in cell wall biosynthesis
MKQKPLVAVLMCTYNGEKYIAEQIESIVNQSHKNLILIISDDGSQDKTIEIVEEKATKYPNLIKLIQGPRKGFVANFLSVATNSNIKADYFSFSDQDDYWQPKKIEAALEIIQAHEEKEAPFLYCGRTTYTDELLKPYGISCIMKRPPSFKNSLIQSIAGGNTMVFNAQSKKLLEKTGVVNVASHDWWLYQLTTGVGGKVYYDSRSFTLYRQHTQALIGGNTSLKSKIYRVRRMFDNHFSRWISKNIFALKKCELILTRESKDTLNSFISIRKSNAINRMLIVFKCGIYRQKKLGTIIISLASLFKKL